ncbi:hypothetical protein D3C87_637260 [compost metagenome]
MDTLKALEEYQHAVDDYIAAVRHGTLKEVQHRQHKMHEKRRELETQIKRNTK